MRLFFILVVLLVSLQDYATPAKAANLVISDIDDTIKISHVLSTVDSALNANKWENQFLGMAALYRALAIARPGDKFFYVSNAPEFLMGNNHRLFLQYHSFPAGQMLLRQSLFDNSFKITTLRKLIKQWTPNEVILIGDNGEEDAKIYDQVRKDHPAVKFMIYIHQPYSTKNKDEKGAALQANQIGFVTSVDLATEWVHRPLLGRRLISKDQFQQFVENQIPRILSEPEDQSIGELAFPVWLDCRGADPVKKLSVLDILSDYQQRLAERCAGR